MSEQLEDIYNRLEDIAAAIEEDRGAQKIFREKLLTAFLSLKKDVDQEQAERDRIKNMKAFEMAARETAVIISMALSGKKIEAIKEFRVKSGIGLKEAKDLIEYWVATFEADVRQNDARKAKEEKEEKEETS